MTDQLNKAELRRLAEAATGGDWEYRMGMVRTMPDQDGYVAVAVAPSVPKNWRGQRDLNMGYIAAANPAAILSLLDENERIASRLCACRDCGGQGEIYSGHDAYQGHFQPPEPVMDVCGMCGGDGVLGPLEDFESLSAERDQLRAEVEALRKDAARWRHARTILPVDAIADAQVEFENYGLPCDEVENLRADAAIDAAMDREGSANG